MTSIRLRLVDWFKRIGNQIAKQLVDVLGREKVHADTAGNIAKSVVVGVHDSRTESQCDYPVGLARLQEQINELNRGAIVSNVHPGIADRQSPPGPNHDFINHQPSPLGKNYLVNVTGNPAGVEA